MLTKSQNPQFNHEKQVGGMYHFMYTTSKKWNSASGHFSQGGRGEAPAKKSFSHLNIFSYSEYGEAAFYRIEKA